MQELKDEELELVRGGSAFGKLLNPATAPLLASQFTMEQSVVLQLESLKLKIQKDLETQEISS